HPAIAELSASARLLLVPALPFAFPPERLAVGDARLRELSGDAEFPLELRHRHFEMPLTHAGDDRLVRLGIVMRGEGRVLIVQAMQALLHFFLVAARGRVNGKGD